jgi:hypothetical protein
MWICANAVMQGDKKVRKPSEADWDTLPRQEVYWDAGVEKEVRKAFGV